MAVVVGRVSVRLDVAVRILYLTICRAAACYVRRRRSGAPERLSRAPGCREVVAERHEPVSMIGDAARGPPGAQQHSPAFEEMDTLRVPEAAADDQVPTAGVERAVGQMRDRQGERARVRCVEAAARPGAAGRRGLPREVAGPAAHRPTPRWCPGRGHRRRRHKRDTSSSSDAWKELTARAKPLWHTSLR